MNYFEIKQFVKKEISTLNDYSKGEECFLIEETLNLPQEKLLTKIFSKPEIKRITKTIKIRKKGKPLNKIFKRSYFYNNVFYINNNVLAPRLETEILVENALKIAKTLNNLELKVLDLCCGSGIIGITFAKNIEKSFVVLSDISSKALKVAKKNANFLQATRNTKFVKSNLFNNLKEENKFDIILSNPPYIKSKDLKTLSVGVKKYDPKIALDGGQDGLFFYKEIAKNCKKFLSQNGVVLVEIGFNQKKDVEKLFNANGFETHCIKDYSKNDRVVIASVKKEN